MQYTLHQLTVFLKVNRTESITRAAEELNLTQPAVSIQMRNFQDQFDIPLTEVIGRKLHITAFGREIAVAAERILKEVDAINYKAQSYRGLLTGRLRVSVVSTGKYVMPYYLTDFFSLHPNVELVVDVSNKSQVVESLKGNESDFCLVSLLPEHMMIDSLELIENRLCLIANAEFKSPKRQTNPQLLETLTMLYREEGSGTRTSTEQFFKDNQLVIRRKIELTSNEAVKQAVIAGLGCAIMPLIGIRQELESGLLQIVPVKGLPLRSAWRLIWPSRKQHSPVATAFLQYLRENREAINRKWLS